MKKLIHRLYTAMRIWALTLLYETIFITPVDIRRRPSPALGLYILSLLGATYSLFPNPMSPVIAVASYLYVLVFSRKPPKLSIGSSYADVLRKTIAEKPEKMVLIPLGELGLVRAVIEGLIIYSDRLAESDLELSNAALLHAYAIWLETARRRGFNIVKNLTRIPSQ